MKLKSFLKRLVLVEEVVEKFNSPINGEILVYEDLFGKHSMRIGGVSQSGGLVVDIWKTAIKQIFNFKFSCPHSAKAESFCRRVIFNQFLKDTNFKFLILGLGCGNAAKTLSKKFPESKIVGIEIDPKVVEVGNKYFGLGEIKNLQIVISDAINEVSRPKFIIHNTKYNLILIDLYLGKDFPKQAESEEFINGLKKILSDKGIVVFNRFYWGDYKKQARDFEEKLKNYFSKVWTKKTVSNLLIFCQ